MPNVAINITGASYTSRSLPLSAQVTKNLYPEIIKDDIATKSRFVLHSRPGLKLFGTATGVDRGMFEHLGILYKVSGVTLYSVNSGGTHVSLGSIPGTGRCYFAPFGVGLVVVSGGRAFFWSGAALSEVTDTDLESPNSVAHLNNQIIYDGNQGRFATSDVGDATSIDGLNYATAESHADNLLRVYVFNQVLYLMGDKTIEPWYNSGSGAPPFDRLEGAIMSIGLGAIGSVAHNDESMYFLGDDSRVYRVRGTNAQNVSTIATNHAFAGYSTVSDASGWCYSMENQHFYCLSFPSEGKVWCFNDEGLWFEVSSGTGRYRGSSYAYAYRKHLVADYANGNIYEMDLDTFTDNGEAILRERTTGPLTGELLGAPGKSVEMNRFELIMETGVGLAAGQGSNPTIMLQVSDDGGRTWGTERWGNVGKIGQHQIKVNWYALGLFYERILRIKTSDPVNYSIHSANSDVELGI